MNDPVEEAIVIGLEQAGIIFERNKLVGNHSIDFYIPRLKLYIECKRFHTDRTNEQMFGITNYIIICGMEAAEMFKELCFASVRGSG